MTVRARLILTIAGISVLLAVPAIYGASRLAALRDIAREQQAKHARSFLMLGRLQATLEETDRLTRSYLVTTAADQRVAIERSLTQGQMLLDSLQRAYPTDTRPIASRLARIDDASRQVIALMAAGDATAASAEFEQLKPQFSGVHQDLGELAGAVERSSNRDLREAQRISDAGLGTTLLALGGSLLVVLLIGSWTTGAITVPLRRLRGSMAAVAGGDFIVPENLPYRRGDEVGDLARSFSSMAQQLAKLDQMKAEFMSIATHELKTPINVIAGYTELMEEGIYDEPTPRQKEALESVREQTVVLTRLVNQLLDISRLEAGGLTLEMDDVVVRDLFSTVERSFSVLARRKGINFTVEVDEATPPVIRGDSDRLRDQVLGNLLTNALKFTPEGGSVQVRTWGERDEVHFEVSDTGIGIPQDQLPFIFDKFYQVGAQARSTGAGLGLAIAREIVEEHAGSIEAASSEDEGTTFHIVLPVTPADELNDHRATAGSLAKGR